MTNSPEIQATKHTEHPRHTEHLAKRLYVSPDWDDDDDADDDDEEDNVVQGSWRRQQWLSRSEFGSPEWWSRS